MGYSEFNSYLRCIQIHGLTGQRQLLKSKGTCQKWLFHNAFLNRALTFEVVVRVLDDPDHDVLVLPGGGEQLSAVGELHAPNGAEVRRLQLLRELDVLKVEGAAFVRLDPLEAQRVIPPLGVGGLDIDGVRLLGIS